MLIISFPAIRFLAAPENVPDDGLLSTQGSKCYLVAHRDSQMDKKKVNGQEILYSKFEDSSVDTWDFETKTIRGYYFANAKKYLRQLKDAGTLNDINLLTIINAWEVYNASIDPPAMTTGNVNAFLS